MTLVHDGADTRTQARNTYVAQYVDRFVSTSATSSAQYDSVAIAGNGIGAQVFAAQLSKYPQFAGKVTIVAPPVVETRRLINGVSLRGSAADFIGSALGISHEQLLAHIAVPGADAAAYRQTANMVVREGDRFRFTRKGTWQGGGCGASEPVIYGVRNSRLVAGLREILEASSITYVDEKVQSADHLRSFAEGSKPLLVNATTIPGLLSGTSRKPERMVLAVQAPLIAAPSGPLAPADSATALAPLLRREGTIDVGYFTPFSDPLSPRANWYGIFARVIDADSGFDKERELKILTEELFGVAESMGMTVDDPDETLGRALVPASPWTKVSASKPGTLDLKRMYSGGAPCFYADGMISSCVGGVVGAEAVVRGVDPDTAIRRSLRPWRRHNFLWWVETNKIASVADFLMRVNVQMAMAYPHSAGARMWRSAA
ncbi:hypothetical protein EP51_46635 (plasmid) [Rhodococcus opacus]|uniref:Uncharacterized protein n=2 Tax=Rhodococcus opacus TaxID=37919 RepID=A0A076F713_RHOOP|nr:hypothetical protein EP51_46635 [Rhodococcus opacus]